MEAGEEGANQKTDQKRVQKRRVYEILTAVKEGVERIFEKTPVMEDGHKICRVEFPHYLASQQSYNDGDNNSNSDVGEVKFRLLIDHSTCYFDQFPYIFGFYPFHTKMNYVIVEPAERISAELREEVRGSYQLLGSYKSRTLEGSLRHPAKLLAAAGVSTETLSHALEKICQQITPLYPETAYKDVLDKLEFQIRQYLLEQLQKEETEQGKTNGTKNESHTPVWYASSFFNHPQREDLEYMLVGNIKKARIGEMSGPISARKIIVGEVMELSLLGKKKKIHDNGTQEDSAHGAVFDIQTWKGSLHDCVKILRSDLQYSYFSPDSIRYALKTLEPIQGFQLQRNGTKTHYKLVNS